MNFNRENNRIYSTDENGRVIAEVTYPNLSNQVVVIDHTFVDSSLRGQGIASLLMEQVVSELRNKNLKARLTCSYAIKWFDEHPECIDLLDRYNK